jgi:hypothetical protein
MLNASLKKKSGGAFCENLYGIGLTSTLPRTTVVSQLRAIAIEARRSQMAMSAMSSTRERGGA